MVYGAPGRVLVPLCCATTTRAIKAAIQQSQATTVALSWDLGVNIETITKWLKRKTVEDRKTGPTYPSSTVLKADEEAMIFAFRCHTLLPMDNCLYAFQPSLLHLTRSSLHHCWAAAWNIATVRDGQRQAQKLKVQELTYWIFSYRHRRMAHQRR